MVFSRRRTKAHDDGGIDGVTGAFNRRQLDADVADGLDTSDQPTATLMIDVDNFDTYSGRKGSVSGDQVLERVSWVIMSTVRTTDVVYRHDASSFCVLLPKTWNVDALAVADRIRQNVERMPLLAEFRSTISIGVATGAGSDVATTIDRADAALTAGAETGSNRVFVGGPISHTWPAPATPAEVRTASDSVWTPRSEQRPR